MTETNTSKSIEQQMEELRVDGWLVTLKVMPHKVPYIIPGGISEYDQGNVDREVWHGKWVTELMCMNRELGREPSYRGRFAGNGDNAIEAIRDVIAKKAAAESIRTRAQIIPSD